MLGREDNVIDGKEQGGGSDGGSESESLAQREAGDKKVASLA